jgi:hypothetical protein
MLSLWRALTRMLCDSADGGTLFSAGNELGRGFEMA